MSTREGVQRQEPRRVALNAEVKQGIPRTSDWFPDLAIRGSPRRSRPELGLEVTFVSTLRQGGASCATPWAALDPYGCLVDLWV